MKKIKQISLNELPKYTSWVDLLINEDASIRRFKNLQEIVREYNIEKWGVVYKKIASSKKMMSIRAIEKLVTDAKQVAYYLNSKLYLDSNHQAREKYWSVIRKELLSVVKKGDQIIELGAGYGSIAFRVLEDNKFKSNSVMAAEYTDNGINCMRIIGDHYGDRFKTGYCDLTQLKLKELNVSAGSVVFTSCALICLKGLTLKTVKELIKYQPKMVIFFEPISEFWSEKNLLQILWKKYIYKNDYNNSILSDLEKYEKQGLLKIISTKSDVIGENSMLPVSIIKWVPLKIVKNECV